MAIFHTSCDLEAEGETSLLSKGQRSSAPKRKEAAKQGTGGTGRTTVFDYAGTGGGRTWIGTVTLPPGTRTGTHHHGRHEVSIYIVKGRLEIRWGEHLEYVADLEPGDFAYFAPFVPHREFNTHTVDTVDLIAIRSNERIAIPSPGQSRRSTGNSLLAGAIG